MGGNIPGGNFLGGNFPGGTSPGGIWLVGIFRVEFSWYHFIYSLYKVATATKYNIHVIDDKI